ncbi:MAG: ATP synthase F1 subunit gamma [Balneolaceae bacterium]|jgi:F-type H+-transporting ATPase subunit gamma|nr:MAG: ATP synthase F1 subunit gamma [Balneolaceae bacterium]
MANLRDIRDRIGSVKSTQQITKAMKMVAAARLRKAQERIMATRPYAYNLRSVLNRLALSAEEPNRLLSTGKKPDKIMVVIVGSDRGLCGGFNTNLFRYIEDEFKTTYREYLDSGNLSLVCIGRKANEHFTKRGYDVIERHPGFFDDLAFEPTAEIMKDALSRFMNSEYDGVYIAYNEFKTVLSQNRIIEQLLPVTKVDYGIEPVHAMAHDQGTDYIFEPSAADILEQIVPLHVNIQLWRAVLESNASEQGARMAAMDNATENAKEIIRVLNLEYNQARQASITTEISEIVSGAEALSQ